FIQHTVPAVAIAQIQSDGQFLLRNIPALRCRSDANLLHCRSPFYLCFEHVDNLGAYTASRPETGLLISSVNDSNLASGQLRTQNESMTMSLLDVPAMLLFEVMDKEPRLAQRVILYSVLTVLGVLLA